MNIHTDEDAVIHWYYNLLFPADLIMGLFVNRRDRYGNIIQIGNREVALRLAEGTREYPHSIMDRYLKFLSPTGLSTLLCTEIPTCVFLGAGYNLPLHAYKSRKASLQESLRPMHHEVVFDIDISDFDSLRKCCQKRAICHRCWRFMGMASKIIDIILEKDFGMKLRMWLFSGGRGIHCWCFDRQNLTLERELRRSITEYFTWLLLPSGKNWSRLKRHMRHPTVVRLYQIALQYVPAILEEQNCFIQEPSKTFLLNCVNSHLEENELDQQLRGEILDILSSLTSDLSIRIFNILQSASATSDAAAIVLMRSVLHVAYPRIDSPVTRDTTHLLRCPFSVHVNSGCRLVLPFNVEAVDDVLSDVRMVNCLPRLRYETYPVLSEPTLLVEDLLVNVEAFEVYQEILKKVCKAIEQEEPVKLGSYFLNDEFLNTTTQKHVQYEVECQEIIDEAGNKTEEKANEQGKEEFNETVQGTEDSNNLQEERPKDTEHHNTTAEEREKKQLESIGEQSLNKETNTQLIEPSENTNVPNNSEKEIIKINMDSTTNKRTAREVIILEKTSLLPLCKKARQDNQSIKKKSEKSQRMSVVEIIDVDEFVRLMQIFDDSEGDTDCPDSDENELLYGESW